MSGFGQSRRDLADLWKERVDNALSRYRSALTLCVRAVIEQSDSAPQNGAPGFTEALHGERAALAEYKRVLCIYTDLVVSGKMPPAE